MRMLPSPDHRYGEFASLAALLASVSAAVARWKTAQKEAERRRSTMVLTAAQIEKALEKALPFDVCQQVGVTQPLLYFDPLGFAIKGDRDGFRELRAAELKHGRVAMMAAVGALAQHYLRLPGFEDVPSGLRAAVTPPGSYGFAALIAAAAYLELFVWKEDSDREPGNFGDPLGLGNYDEDMRNRELNNGRFAMVATSGILLAEILSGDDAVEQLKEGVETLGF